MATPDRTVRVRNTAARRPARPTPLADIEKHFLQFVTSWRAASTEGKKRDKARDRIKEWFEKGGDGQHDITVNENGSLAVEFGEAVVVDGVRVTGLTNKRSDTSSLDLDLVDAWLDSLDEKTRDAYTKRLYKPVTDVIFDPDELFAMQQRGEISESVLDSLYSTSTSWSLCVDKD